ncbi:hypothetical protein [Salinibacter altiplanensis]|uniref:hypothetical protein n=1 Tax=Salinibacter altiplanensis TaxID=1803181 RepID=UPI000C9FB59C|nr:hypothetical protein [Salinibacter altiplanensis]
MRRTQILEAVKNIRTEIEESGIIEALDDMRHMSDDTQVQKKVFRAYTEMMNYARGDMSLSEEEVMAYLSAEKHPDLFPLEESEVKHKNTIFSPSYWEDIVAGSPSPDQILYALSHTTSLVQLLSSVEGVIEPGTTSELDYDDDEKITVVLSEPTDGRTAKNLADVLQAIDKLYSIHLDVLSREGKKIPDKRQNLRVLSTDTGSELIATLGGAVSIIIGLKKLYEAIWGPITQEPIYTDRARSELGTMDESLELHQKISRLEEEGELTEEDAQIKRNEINTITRKMVREGVITSDIEEEMVENTGGLPERRTRFFPEDDEDTQDES